MKIGNYITLEIYAIEDNGKITYYLGDSDWNRSRITSDYEPMNEKITIQRFKSYLKESKESLKNKHEIKS